MDDIKFWASLLNEENDQEIDFTDDELDAQFPKSKLNPSYADVEKIAQREGTPKEEVITKEEYDALSDEDKSMIALGALEDPEQIDREYQEVMKHLSGEDKIKYEKFFENPEMLIKDIIDTKENAPNVYVFVRELQTDQTEPDVTKRIKVDNQETKKFLTLEDAKKFVYGKVKDDIAKYGMKLEDFKIADVVPEDILKKDPNAIGFLYSSTTGKNKKFIQPRGKGAKDVKDADKDFYYDNGGPKNKDADYSTVDTLLFIEYIIYQSDEEIKSSQKDLTELFSETQEPEEPVKENDDLEDRDEPFELYLKSNDTKVGELSDALEHLNDNFKTAILLRELASKIGKPKETVLQDLYELQKYYGNNQAFLECMEIVIDVVKNGADLFDKFRDKEVKRLRNGMHNKITTRDMEPDEI